MRRTKGAVILLFLLLPHIACGQLIAYESFSGIRLGSGLTGSGSDALGWTDGGWANGMNSRFAVVVPSPTLGYQIGGGAFVDGSGRAVRLTTNPEPVPVGLLASREFAPQNTTIYFSFLVRPTAVGSGSDALTLQFGNGEGFFQVMALRPDPGQQYFNLTDGDSTSAGISAGTHILRPFITYLVVGRITWAAQGIINVAKVDSWVNPPATYPGDGIAFGYTDVSSPAVFNSVGLGIFSSDTGGPTSSAVLDEIRIGYTWDDVVPQGPPRLANISTRGVVQTGDNILIGGFIITGNEPKKVMLRAIGPSLPLSGALQNPTLELYGPSGLIDSNDDWVKAPNKQEIIDSTLAPTSDFESAILTTLPANNTGYTAVVRGANNDTGIALVEAYDLGDPSQSTFANISTRGVVQTGDNVMIGGLIVAGTDSQQVIVRAIGPSLPVSGQLADPMLDLYDSNGSLVASNDDWRDTQERQIIATGIPPPNHAESAIVQTLTPGAYTAVVRGKNAASGVALVEAYAIL